MAKKRSPAAGGFQKRLLRAQQQANFTVADLARWFDRPHPTVRCWTKGTRPSGGPIDSASVEKALMKLETLLGRKKLPLPWLRPKEKIKQLRVLRG